jgi:polyisoprenoid-binding protein YceI
MKIGIYLFTALSIMIGGCTNSSTSEDQNDLKTDETLTRSMSVDINASSIDWTGEMLGLYSHSGSLKFKDGKIAIREGKIISAELLVDMSTILATDGNFKGVDNHTPEALVEHLKSADFFDVENHPYARLVFKNYEGNNISAILEIKGVQQLINLENVEIYEEQQDVSFVSGFKFNRQKFGVSHKMTVPDMVISDDVTVLVKLVAN